MLHVERVHERVVLGFSIEWGSDLWAYIDLDKFAKSFAPITVGILRC